MGLGPDGGLTVSLAVPTSPWAPWGSDSARFRQPAGTCVDVDGIVVVAHGNSAT